MWQPFVVEVAGHRFGKYPPGWPAVLSLGVLAGLPWLVNPLLGGVTLYLLYRIGREVAGDQVGLLAAGLGATSLLHLTLSGSLMSHSASAALFLLFCLAFLRARRTGGTAWATTAGLSLGAGFLIRPFTALALALPPSLYVLIQVVREGRCGIRRWIPMALGALAVAAFLPLFNWVVAGDPLANAYQLVYARDRLGFGPAVGPQGYAVGDALAGLATGIVYLGRDLLGWPWISWLGVLAGLLLPPRSRRDWTLLVPWAGLALGHSLYWFSGMVPYGPRYQYEGATLLWLLTAVGVKKLDSCLGRRWWRAAAVIFALLLASNLLLVMPARARALRGLYGVTRAWLAPLDEANLEQALVFCVGSEWRDCRAIFARMDPFARGEVVYARSCSAEQNAALIADMPGRAVYRFDGHTLERVDVLH